MNWNPAVGIPLAIIGLVAIILIYFFGRPRKLEQGHRRFFQHSNSGRIEPSFDGDEAVLVQGELDASLNEELERLGSNIAEQGNTTTTPPRRTPSSAHASRPIERILTLFVAARGGETITGTDLVVATEKAGLEFGDMGIFHRFVVGRPEQGPVFSMANMIKPGHFDMTKIETMQTPGVSFFMALPGPIPALDAWDAMLPTVQRLAELLDARVLDEERNALGRQRIAHIRDELRTWDRKQEHNQIRPGW